MYFDTHTHSNSSPNSAAKLASPAHVAVVDPTSSPHWDAQIWHFQNVTAFHTTAWSRILRDTYRFRPLFFTCSSNDRLTAVLPLAEVSNWLAGRRAVSLPFTDQCCPLFSDFSSLQLTLDAAARHARARQWKSIEYRSWSHSTNSSMPDSGFHGHQLDLTQGKDKLWCAVDRSVRRAIGTARSHGIRVEVRRDLDSVHTFHRLLCNTRQRHGLPSQPFRLLANIHRHILAKDLGSLVLTMVQGRPVAGLLFLQFADHAALKFAAWDQHYHSLCVNNVTMWEAIKWHALHGYATIDFGCTSMRQEGLRRFKLSWGARERHFEYVTHDVRKDCFIYPSDAATSWQNRVFRTLPARLSRLVGFHHGGYSAQRRNVLH